MTRFASAALAVPVVLALTTAVLTMAAACSKTPPEPTSTATTVDVPKSSAPTTASSSAPTTTQSASTASAAPGANPDDIAYDAPKSWQSMPNPNQMRKATFKIAKTGGDTEDAELTVSSASGGVDANVKRWAGQFGNAEPKTEPRTVNGLKVTIVEIKGAFAGGGPAMGPAAGGGGGGSKDKYMLLGAVVDTGEKQHFFKMTGPEKTVSAARKDFDAFVSSFRAK